MRSSVQRVAIVPQIGRFVKHRAGPPRQAAGRGSFPAFWQWGQAGNAWDQGHFLLQNAVGRFEGIRPLR